jgi:hypothetical protein
MMQITTAFNFLFIDSFFYYLCIAKQSNEKQRSNAVSAQTLDQARTMFTKGQYAKAKPVFDLFC